ncbi:ArnT family glycosyltransferase, partial [Amycolatopsis rhizosphaerae]|uniref:ArnT family glycosyltransferase n=1 Tax=Amycolatopsis rhizosphaerae TaxID=2053003 RepID=UPI0016438CDA
TTSAPETGGIGQPGAGRDPAAWLIGGTALLLGAVFVGADLAFNQGKLIAPLDDVYIHLQYGRQLGLGHFLRYNTGDPVSAGASSMLYLLVLGGAYAIGFQGHLFLGFAVGFGVLCFAFSAAGVYRLGTRLVARPAGIWAGLLTAFSGPLLWGTTSGMEVGLAMLLVVYTLVVFAREMPSGRFHYTPLVAALLALVRPEGLIFAGALTLAAWWVLWSRRRIAGTGRSVARWVWTLLPLLAFAGQLLFYQLATGTASANGIQAKSLLHDRPEFYFTEFADRTVTNVRAFAMTLLGFGNQDFAFPGALLLFFAGVAYLIHARRSWRPLVLAMTAGLGAVLVSVATLNTALVHNMRYEQPFLPVFLLFVVSAWYGATRLVPPRARRSALHAGLAAALVFSLAAVPTWAIRFGRDASAIRDTDVSVGAWISGNLPPDAVVAVKDVGAVAYFGKHRVVDLIGLGTNGLAEPANNGIGSLYEALRHLPAAQRPAYFATYDTGPGPSLAQLRSVGILDAEPVQLFKVQTPRDLNGRLIVPFEELGVDRADWTLAGSGDRQPVPGDLRDYLNVGDVAAERGHDYAPRMAQVGMQPVSVLARNGDVIDSGRMIMGGEEFTARNLIPGQPLTITARTAMDKVVPDMLVVVNGVPAGVWTRPVETAPWSTATFTVPARLVTGSSVGIELRQPRPLLNPYPVYTSFGYWFSQ